MKIFTVLALLFLSAPSFADDVYGEFIKKSEEKKQSRWSLDEWLETRDKMRLMDLWLYLHSPSPYEFFIGGNYQVTYLDSGPKLSALRTFEAEVGAYASIVGLEARYLGFRNRVDSSLNIRVFGAHHQGTNLTLRAGARFESRDPKYMNFFSGASATLYLLKAFGIEGAGRYYFPSKAISNVNVKETQWEVGGFLDFNILRVYAQYLWENRSYSQTSSLYEQRTGLRAGIRLYF